jgi:uncharacterized cupin superfamily protein
MRRISIAGPKFEYDGNDPEGFQTGLVSLGKLLGAAVTGISVYELPPGQAICPYHYELGEEEWLLVLEGNPTLRTPEGAEALDPWDVVCFPRGPEGAHGLRNETDDHARVLMFSNVVIPTAAVYPDSDKVGIWTGDSETDLMARRADAVGYYEGET